MSGTCVEVNLTELGVAKIRDSKDLSLDPQSSTFTVLEMPIEAWTVFLSEVTEQTPPGTNGSISLNKQLDGDVVLTSKESNASLRYDTDEWAAFKAGVADGDFEPPLASDDI